MNLLQNIDLYCERLSFSLFAEPLNLISNGAFLIAAFFAWGYFKSRNPHILIKVLILNLAIIGIGSALFHSFANILTQLADVIPIAIYVFIYLYTYQVLILKHSNLKIILNFALFIFLTTLAIIFIPENLVNGSNSYFGCILMVFIFALQTKSISLKKNKNYLLLAGSLLCLSIFFRSIDQIICPVFPIGTHFLWHALNGLALLVTLFAVDQKESSTQSA